MENMNELNLNELEDVTGGKNEGGYETKPKDKKNCKIYQIKQGDRLGKIATANNTTVKAIMDVNPELKNANFIVIGCYIYIPV